MLQFKDMVFDDYTVDDEGHYWSQICPACLKKYIPDNRNIDEAGGNGICGIKGCDNEADFYIDFGKLISADFVLVVE